MDGNRRTLGQKSPELTGNLQWSRASHWKEPKRSKVKGSSQLRKFGRGIEREGVLQLKVLGEFKDQGP